ncbi:hypothetical protein T492DRAFT_1043342 [Pavlovales sp. CCMP2436]|nr:hypothetical protein T492DRAFT_1043342 [Pavlovales sp. CCMP2436]
MPATLAQLELRVVCASCLLKAGEERAEPWEEAAEAAEASEVPGVGPVVSPFVTVEVFGGAFAEVRGASARNERSPRRGATFHFEAEAHSNKGEASGAEWRSSSLASNGLCAFWPKEEAVCVVSASHSELAIVWVGVWTTRLGRATLLAYEAFPLALCRSGWRTICLRGRGGRRARFCNLLVHAQARMVPNPYYRGMGTVEGVVHSIFGTVGK